MKAFKIDKFKVVSEVIAEYISQPAFFIDEPNSLYRATVKTYDAEGNFIGNKEVSFTQEEYDNWGTDNNYIYNLIHTKLGTQQIGNDLVELSK